MVEQGAVRRHRINKLLHRKNLVLVALANRPLARVLSVCRGGKYKTLARSSLLTFAGDFFGILVNLEVVGFVLGVAVVVVDGGTSVAPRPVETRPVDVIHWFDAVELAQAAHRTAAEVQAVATVPVQLREK